MTPIYQTAVQNFTKTFLSTGLRSAPTGLHIGMASSRPQVFLRYLHVIASQTLAGQRTIPGNVTLLDTTYLLSHIHKGIIVEMGRIIARIARNFVTNLRKQSLRLGPFITQIVHYLEIDIDGANVEGGA